MLGVDSCGRNTLLDILAFGAVKKLLFFLINTSLKPILGQSLGMKGCLSKVLKEEDNSLTSTSFPLFLEEESIKITPEPSEAQAFSSFSFLIFSSNSSKFLTPDI